MKYIIGIDEVGRGPLAGPVTVAALAIPEKFHKKFLVGSAIPDFFSLQLSIPQNSGPAAYNLKLILRDSKKLSPVQRERWFQIIKSHPKIFYAASSVYPKTIDRINITASANLATSRALKKLLNLPVLGLRYQKVDIFLDYGLKPRFPRAFSAFSPKIKTLVRADEIIPAVSLASIAAKVLRDRYMTREHKNYSEYNFQENKGYGVKKHIQAIQKYGPSSLHRLTFLKNCPILK